MRRPPAKGQRRHLCYDNGGHPLATPLAAEAVARCSAPLRRPWRARGPSRPEVDVVLPAMEAAAGLQSHADEAGGKRAQRLAPRLQSFPTGCHHMSSAVARHWPRYSRPGLETRRRSPTAYPTHGRIWACLAGHRTMGSITRRWVAAAMDWWSRCEHLDRRWWGTCIASSTGGAARPERGITEELRNNHGK
jgi:hypothetical protein